MPTFPNDSSPDHKLKAGLYLIATPIGNLEDITLRALRILKSVDLLLCEDKRTSSKLLNHYGIKVPLLAYHDHNSEKLGPNLIEQIQNGAAIGLISDAGTPLISDPGFQVVQLCLEKNLYVTSLPGPCAFVTALTIAGLPVHDFHFGSFLPTKPGERRSILESMKLLQSTLIFYESPHRILKTLIDIEAIFHDRKVVLCRELTKYYEERLSGTAADLHTQISKRESIKGEFVLLIQGAAESDFIISEDDLHQKIKDLLHLNLPVKEMRDRLSAETGRSKKEIYQLILSFKDAQAIDEPRP